MPHTSDITPNIIALYRHGDGLSVICIDVERHIGSHNYPCSCLGFYQTNNLLPDLLHTKEKLSTIPSSWYTVGSLIES